MKTYKQDELKKIYTARKEKLLAYMTEHGITAAVFEDCEERRNTKDYSQSQIPVYTPTEFLKLTA